MKTRNQIQGFTLVELLVVIAIIGILIGMLLPAVQQVRMAARRIECGNQQRQMALAALNYESAYMTLPPGTQHSTSGNNNTDLGWSWRALLLPYIEQGSLANQFDMSLNLVDPINRPLLVTVVPTYVCPSDGELNTILFSRAGTISSKASYVGNGGAFLDSFRPQLPQFNAVLGRTLTTAYRGVELGRISDGTSNTMFTAEMLSFANVEGSNGAATQHEDINGNRSNFVWDPALYGTMTPSGVVCCTLAQVRTGLGLINPPEDASILIKRNSFGSNHVAGMNVAFMDGSTHYVNDTIEHNQLSYNDFLDGNGSLGVFQRLLGTNDGMVNGEVF